MSDQRIGYPRVSAFEQNPERQIELLHAQKIFIDYQRKLSLRCRRLVD